jgi:Flp pilus assembly protein TadD
MQQKANLNILQPPPSWAELLACKRVRWVSVFILLAVTLTYLPVGKFGFVALDDYAYVVENPVVQQGLTLRGLIWAFGFQEANWHPLTWISHMLDVTLFGRDATGPHWINILLHGLTAVGWFLVLTRWTGRWGPSAFVAGVFALHPLHVESVAWISERKDVLSTFFLVLTLAAFGEYATRADRGLRARSWYVAAIGFYALGLMSKPMLVTVPFLLLLLDYWPWGRIKSLNAWSRSRRLVQEKVPFLVLAVGSSVFTLLAQSSAGAVQSAEQFPLGYRLANACVAYARYLGKAFWPVDLAVHYPHPEAPGWPLLGVIASGLLVLVLTVISVTCVRRTPAIVVGWLWFLGMLVPVIGLVQVGIQSIADRYMHVPIIGLGLAVAWAGELLILKAERLLIWVCAFAAVLVGLMGISARYQTQFWRNTEALFCRSLDVTRQNPLIHKYLVNEYYTTGNSLREQGRLDLAEAKYRLALALDPAHSQARNNLGATLQGLGQLEMAGREYALAVQSNPTNVNARNNFAVALVQLGNYPQAIEQLEISLSLEPGNPAAYNNLGALLGRQGQWARALTNYLTAIRLTPNMAAFHVNAGEAWVKLDNPQKAKEAFENALRLEPDNGRAQENLRRLSSSAAAGPNR